MADSYDIVQALRDAIVAEMEADHTVVLVGEETAEGGLFGVTEGLSGRFADRVYEIPYDEGARVGAAVGMAISGLRPVVELLLADHIGLALQQIAGELANLRYATGGEFAAPVVVRMPVGRGTCGGPRQSLSPESLLANVPGLVIVSPSNAADAYGLMRAAIRSDDPVVFAEPKQLYRVPQPSSNGADPAVPLGVARVVSQGEDLTVVTWGAGVPISLRAMAWADDVSVEVIDLRTLVPMDVRCVLGSVARTGRAVVVHDGPRTGGFGAEVAALIAEGALEYLQAPVLRVAAADAPVPAQGEAHGAIDARRVFDAIRATADYV